MFREIEPKPVNLENLALSQSEKQFGDTNK